MTENLDSCPACDFLATLPDFDDPRRFDERRDALEARRRGGGRGYGFIAVTAVTADDSSTYGLVRAALRHDQQLWDAVLDAGDGTFHILVDGGEHERVESLRMRVERSVRLVLRSARFKGAEVVTTALGSDEGGADTEGFVWTAFEASTDEVEALMRRPRARVFPMLPAASA